MSESPLMYPAAQEIADLALRSRSRSEFRDGLFALLERELDVDCIALETTFDGHAWEVQRRVRAKIASAASSLRSVPDSAARTHPQLFSKWRGIAAAGAESRAGIGLSAHAGEPLTSSRYWTSPSGRHGLVVTRATCCFSAADVAKLERMLPAIKLAEAHWLAVERLRGEHAKSPESDGARARDDAAAAPPGSGPSADFARAVRTGLRFLHELSRLAGNDLVGSRMVRARASATPAGDAVRALRQLLEEAVAGLAENGRTEPWHRALHHTYVVPAETQLAAADRACMSFGTYRRCVARGLEELATRLWLLELGTRASALPEVEADV